MHTCAKCGNGLFPEPRLWCGACVPRCAGCGRCAIRGCKCRGEAAPVSKPKVPAGRPSMDQLRKEHKVTRKKR